MALVIVLPAKVLQGRQGTGVQMACTVFNFTERMGN